MRCVRNLRWLAKFWWDRAGFRFIIWVDFGPRFWTQFWTPFLTPFLPPIFAPILTPKKSAFVSPPRERGFFWHILFAGTGGARDFQISAFLTHRKIWTDFGSEFDPIFDPIFDPKFWVRFEVDMLPKFLEVEKFWVRKILRWRCPNFEIGGQTNSRNQTSRARFWIRVGYDGWNLEMKVGSLKGKIFLVLIHRRGTWTSKILDLSPDGSHDLGQIK